MDAKVNYSGRGQEVGGEIQVNGGDLHTQRSEKQAMFYLIRKGLRNIYRT